MTTQDPIKEAKNLGSIARMNGKPCVPAQDPKMIELSKKLKDYPDRANFWKAWSDGWTQIHLEYFDIEFKQQLKEEE